MGDMSLVVDYLNGTDQVTERMNELEKRVINIGQLSAKGLIPSTEANKRVSELKTQFGEMGGAIDKTFKAGIRSAGQFDMRLLSVMFGGMALSRAFGGILRSITTTFLKAEGDTSMLTKKTTELSAAWDFFKFSLFDALNTPFFGNIIEGLIGLINWFSQLSENAKLTILGIVSGLAIIGKGLLVIGQVGLAWGSIFGTGGFLAETKIMNTAAFGAGGIFTKLKAFAATALAIKMAFDLDKYFQGERDLAKTIDAFGTDLGLLGFATNTPWLIGVGIVMKLLPYGEKIKDFGFKLLESSGKRFMKGVIDRQKGLLGQAKNFWNVGTGAAGMFGGLVLGGSGFVLQGIDENIKNIDAMSSSASKSLEKDLLPKLNDVNTAFNGDKGMSTAIGETRSEFELLATDTTPQFQDASEAIGDELDTITTKADNAKLGIVGAKDALEGFIRLANTISRTHSSTTEDG